MWDKISLGFDQDEETINFGCRKMAVCDSAVYETNTLAVFSKENEEEKSNQIPRVSCISYSGIDSGIIVAINESLIAFNSCGDEMRNRCVFNAVVDCFSVIRSGSLMFIALNNGDVLCSLLQSNRNHIFLKNICDKVIASDKIFINMFIRENGNVCDLILVTCYGTIYKLKNFNIEELTRACVSQSSESIIKITDTIIQEEFSLCKNPNDELKVVIAQEYPINQTNLLWIVVEFSNRQILQIWSDDQFFDSMDLPSDCKLKKIEFANNGSRIYGLTYSGSLLVICTYTITSILHQTNLNIENFEVMKEEDDSLLVLTNEPKYQLKLLSVPGFKAKFQLDINDVSFLAKNQKSLDDLLYLEGQCKKEEADNKWIDSIHLKVISESQPEYRLERILRRGKFEEAEGFARSFKLDVEIVYKAHLQALLSEIQPWSSGKVSFEESSTKLKSLLQKVQDIEFVGKCAVNLISSDFILMKEIMNYTENRIRIYLKEKNTENTSTVQDLYNQIRNALLRLNTFVAISEKPLTAEKWLEFCKVNLIEECQSLLQQGSLKQVILIWSRHIYEMKKKLTLDQALFFLKAIPSSTPADSVLCWLRIFLPDCLVLFPNILKNVISWCKEKVNVMELRRQQDWPESGVTFLKKVLKIIRKNVLSCKIFSENVIQSEYASNSPINDIIFYIKILCEIAIIKKNYGVLVTIREYTQDNDQEVIFTILDKIPLEELNSFIEGFMKSMIVEKHLNTDSVISEYIQCLVEGSVNWWYWEEAPWESRVAVLINCISSIEEKLKCVLCVLKYSPVPWSPIISSICDQALKHKNPLTKLINEQRKLINCKLILKKYDLKDNTLSKFNVKRIIRYIFAQARTSLLKDALQIANTFDFEMVTEVYKLYVEHLLKKGEFNEVLSFLDDDSLPLKALVKCCEDIILTTHCLSSVECMQNKYENYVEVLDSVEAKLTRAICKLKASGETVSSVITPGICKQLKCIHYLKVSYNLNLKSQDFKEHQQDELLNYCLKDILKNMINDSKIIEKESLKLTELSSYFEYTKEEIYIKFIHLVISEKELNIAIYLSRLLLKDNDFSKNIAKQLMNLAGFIFQHCINSSVKYSDDDIASVLYEMVISGLNTCSLYCLPQGAEISKWCKLMLNPLHSRTEIDIHKHQTNYSQNMNFNTMMTLLKLFSAFLKENNLKSCVFLSNSNSKKSLIIEETESEIEQASKLPEFLEVLTNEHEQAAFQTITTLHWSIIYHCFLSNRKILDISLISETEVLSARCVSKLLKKLIGSRHLDCQFGLALLHYFPVEKASNWIVESTKKYRHDFQRLHAITELGMVYFHKHQRPEEWNFIYKLRKQCVWGKQIIEYGFSYKEAFRDAQHDQRQLLLKLMTIPSVNIDILEKYCKDVKFDFQSCLKRYLSQILLTWEPQFEVKVDTVTGEKTIYVKPTHTKLLQKCREICNLFENVDDLNQTIVPSIWNSVNYYYYEVFLILITLLEERGMKLETSWLTTCRTVFLFLTSYQRISKPQEFEKDQWYHSYPNEQSLPPISEYRLPFNLIHSRICRGDPWKIIRHELNISTYTKWFTVLDALELDRNVLCTMAVNQIVSDALIDQTVTEGWCIHLRNQKLLADVKACIENISNLEMSCAALYYLVNHLPPGADQLAAAKLCYVHTKQWRDSENSEKAETGYQKVQKKYLTISTTHILYIHNLGKPSYLQLVLEPYELINAIYNDPIILQKNSGNVISFPDINKAAEEISTLHKTDIKKIRMELLEEWLQPENFIANLSTDETIIRQHMGDSITEAKFSCVEYQNFQRACYVVERDIESYGQHLVKIVFDHNSDDSKPVSVRLRALQCLYAVTSEDVLERITNNSIDYLRRYLKRLEFVMELEALGLTYSISAFESSDKYDIARTLTALKNPRAIRLAAILCQYFEIDRPAIWNGILLRMCSYKMVKELFDVLPHLSDNYHTLDVATFQKAWNTVLLHPLEKAPIVPCEEDMETIEKSVELLYFCPIADQIDIQSIKKQCLRIQRTDLAENIQDING